MLSENRIRDLFDIEVEVDGYGQTKYTIHTPPGYIGHFYDLVSKLKEQAIHDAKEERRALEELKEEFDMSDQEFEDWLYRIHDELDWA